MQNHLKEIKDVTPQTRITLTRKMDEDGKIILPYSDDGFPIIYLSDCEIYGDNTIGLVDGSKLREEDWKNLRQGFILVNEKGKQEKHFCIGGSDSAVCCGASKYKQACTLAEEKLGKPEKEISINDEHRFEYGHILEELAAKDFAAKTGLTVVKNSMVFFDRKTGFMQANVDYFVENPFGGYEILECKTAHPFSTNEWSDDNVPLSYQYQAVGHYPAVLRDLNIKGTYFVLLTNNNFDDVQIRHFDIDIDFQNETIKAEKTFIDYINKGEIPPIDLNQTDTALEILKEKYRVSNGETIELPDKLSKIIKKAYSKKKLLSYINKKKKETENEIENLKTRILSFLEDNEKGKIAINGVPYIVTFGTKKEQYTITPTKVRELIKNEPELWQELLEKGYPTFNDSATRS